MNSYSVMLLVYLTFVPQTFSSVNYRLCKSMSAVTVYFKFSRTYIQETKIEVKYLNLKVKVRVLRWQSHRRSGLATLSPVGAVP